MENKQTLETGDSTIIDAQQLDEMSTARVRISEAMVVADSCECGDCDVAD